MSRYNDAKEYIKYFGENDTSFPHLLAIIVGETVCDSTIDTLGELGLSGISQLSEEELLKFEGITTETLFRIKALNGILNMVPKFDWQSEFKISSKFDVIEYVRDIRYKQDSQLDLLFLNKNNVVIGRQNIVKGTRTLNKDLVHLAFRQAIKRNASKIVVCSNEPAGYAVLKDEDYSLFDYFLSISNLMNVEVLDHIILGKKMCVSIAEEITNKSKGELA
jgi:DNA repair protein RadC